MLQTLLNLFSLLAPKQKIRLLLLQFLVIISSFFEVISVLSIGPFMTVVADPEIIASNIYFNEFKTALGISDVFDLLLAFALLIMILLIISAALSMLTLWRLSVYSQEIGADLSNRLYDYYLEQPWLFHASGNSSELINKVSQECQRLTDSVLMPTIQTMSKIVLSTFMIISLLIYDPWLALIGSSGFILFYFGVYVSLSRQFGVNGEDISSNQSLRFKLMNEGFGGIKDVLVLGRKKYFMDKFHEASFMLAKAKGLNVALSQIPRYAIEFLALSAVVSLIIYQIIFNSSSLSALIPSLSVYTLATFKLLPAFQQIYFNVSSIKGNLAAFFAIQDNLEASKPEITPLEFISEPKESRNFKKMILENISFTYPGMEGNVLQDISLEISSNQVIGFAGSSGAGKTTLIDIILGLISQTNGNFWLDGTELKAENLRLWQDKIGCVSQNIFLSDATIEENIAFGIAPNLIDAQKINSAMKLSHLDDFVISLEDGLQTRVGERGVQLSGGQKQRIGIARALYHDPEILIFDEATSALDGITEKVIMNAIHDFTGKKTILIIAHRLATIRRCNKIFLIDNGSISDSGTYEELIETSSLFRKMVENA